MSLPAELVDRLVAAMVPLRVCVTCGEPSRRIVEATKYETARELNGRPIESLGGGHRADRPNATPVALGFTDCGHDNWRPGVVLFVGEVDP